MKVVDVKVTDGPNYWSIARHRLIVMLLDLEEMEEYPTNKIPGFYERIKQLLPSLYEHRCSEGRPGGFFERVKEGTWMGHVIEHIALEIQTLAGMNTGFGRTRSTGRKGVYHVVFSYEDAEAGKYAALAAVRIAESLVQQVPYDLQRDIKELKSIFRRNRFGPSTGSIVQAAVKRNIPFIRLNDDSFVQLGYGAAQKRIEATIASTTSNIAVEIACDKEATRQLLANNYIPVPEGQKIADAAELPDAIAAIGYPVVIKPLDGNHGKGVTTNIRNQADALKAFEVAKNYSAEVICEKFITGLDFRILLVNYKLTAAALRTPAAVTGDGIHTIQQLTDLVNEEPGRGDGHENILTKIIIDQSTINLLNQQGYNLNTVLPAGKTLWLKPTANLSTGGTATDVTELVHPDNKALFERVARTIGLDICGIDVMAPGLSDPIKENGGAILEVNAAPGFRMHTQPSSGKARDVGQAVIDMLFPDGNNGRIPIIAITGTNGKTTTTRLLAHITKQAGYKTGYTTTDGIYIHDQLILQGDCTGPVSARTVLKDPGVDMAVLECARGGILRSGLGFDQCDIAIVTNVGEDHLGLQGINSVEDLARVKSIVPESVKPDGYAILNADDDIVYNMQKNLRCRLALFSLDASNPRITAHIERGGLAAVYDNGFVTLLQGKNIIPIGKAIQMPVTFEGKATFNIANVLAASLAAWLQKITPANILTALRSFYPCPQTIPGRMNIFDFPTFKVMVDYAHNAHGLKAIAGFVKSIPASVRLGVITGVGDRRDEDIAGLGVEAASIFDEIIIRHDNDLRGRKPEEIEKLICQGIQQVDSNKKVTVISEEAKAVDFVLKNAKKGCLAVVFADDTRSVINQLQQAHTMEQLVETRGVA